MSQQIDEPIIQRKDSTVSFGKNHASYLQVRNVDFEMNTDKAEIKVKEMKQKKSTHENDSCFEKQLTKVQSEESMLLDSQSMYSSVVLQVSQGGLLNSENSENKSQGLKHNLSGMNSINFSLTIEDHTGISCISVQDLKNVVRKSSLPESDDLCTRPIRIFHQNQMKNENLGSIICQSRKNAFVQQINIRGYRMKSPDNHNKLNPFEEIVISPTYTLKNKIITKNEEKFYEKEQLNEFDEEKTNFEMRQVILQPYGLSIGCENNMDLITKKEEKTASLELKEVDNTSLKETQNICISSAKLNMLPKINNKNFIKFNQELQIIPNSDFTDTRSNPAKYVYPNQHQWESEDNHDWDHKFQETSVFQQETEKFSNLPNKNERSDNFEQKNQTQQQNNKQRMVKVNRGQSISSLELSGNKMEENACLLNETAQTLFPSKNEIFLTGLFLPSKKYEINRQNFIKSLKIFPNLNSQQIPSCQIGNSIPSNQKCLKSLLTQDLSQNIPDFDNDNIYSSIEPNLNTIKFNQKKNQNILNEPHSKQFLFKKQNKSTFTQNFNKPNKNIRSKSFNFIKLFPYFSNIHQSDNFTEVNYQNGIKNQMLSQTLYQSTTPRLNSLENKIICVSPLKTNIQENVKISNLPINKLEELRLKKKKKMMAIAVPEDKSLNFKMIQSEMETPRKKGINIHMPEQTIKKVVKNESVSPQNIKKSLRSRTKTPQSQNSHRFLTLYSNMITHKKQNCQTER